MMLDKIYNCDYKEGFKEIPDGMVSLCLCDPPYYHHKSPGKPYSERKQCNTKSAFSNSELYNYDCDMIKGMSDFDDKCIDEFLTLLEPKMKIMNAYIFCSETQVPYYAMWAENNGYMFSILVWEKPLSIINKNRFSQNLEYIVRIYDYGTALHPESLYSEQLPGGFIQVLLNEDGQETKVNIEALFNAVHKHKDLIKNLLNE